jgi:hypothetical protein
MTAIKVTVGKSPNSGAPQRKVGHWLIYSVTSDRRMNTSGAKWSFARKQVADPALRQVTADFGLAAMVRQEAKGRLITV